MPKAVTREKSVAFFKAFKWLGNFVLPPMWRTWMSFSPRWWQKALKKSSSSLPSTISNLGRFISFISNANPI
jgi:hypothetical protein